jgi:hypothetical protein
VSLNLGLVTLIYDLHPTLLGHAVISPQQLHPVSQVSYAMDDQESVRIAVEALDDMRSKANAPSRQ